MEIYRIRAQSAETLREFYDPRSSYRKPLYVSDRMLALFGEPERVDHPPVWAYTSHMALLFKETDDVEDWLVFVAVAREEWMEQARFRVTYALPDPWYSALTYAEDPAEAAQLVVDGLQRAHRGKRRNVAFE